MTARISSLFQDFTHMSAVTHKDIVTHRDIVTHKDIIKVQASLHQGKSLKAAAHQMLSHPQPASRIGPFSSPVPHLAGSEEDPLPLPESSAAHPRTSEEPKLPGLTLLSITKDHVPYDSSALEEPRVPSCRNFKRIDCDTVIPGDVYEGMMRLGKAAEKRGAHRLHACSVRRGAKGVLRSTTKEPRPRGQTCPPILEKRPWSNAQEWDMKQHVMGRLSSIERIPEVNRSTVMRI